MIQPKELSADLLAKLRKIDKMHGAQGPFLKKARIDRHTFKRLVREGHAWEQVVNRVEAALKEDPKPTPLTAGTVETIICTGYGITREALHRRTREANSVEAKQLTCYFLFTEARMNKTAIARHFDYADHTTPHDNIKTIEGRIEVESDFKQHVERIRIKLLNAR